MGSFGPLEVALIFLVILLVFGAKRIPEIARGLGKGIREFKSATREIQNEFTIDDRSSQRIQQPQQPAQGTPAPRTPEAQPAEQAPPAQQAPPPDRSAAGQ